jgi:hypothetical protein
MADRELIAAILTAGMLPTMEIPQSRAQGKGRLLTKAEADAIQRAVDHAFGLYRLVLNGLEVDPLAGLPEQINTDTSGDGGVLNRVKLSGEHLRDDRNQCS